MTAVLAFDAELARAPRVTSSSLAAQIRLTWWRDALEEIAASGQVRAHPVARGLAAARSLGLALAPLHEVIDARIVALDGPPNDAEAAAAWADATAGSIAVACGRLLDPEADEQALRLGGRVIGLDQQRGVGTGVAGLDPALEGALLRARETAKTLSPAALPAVLAATLARAPRAPGPWMGIDRRLRLLWAMSTGRL